MANIGNPVRIRRIAEPQPAPVILPVETPERVPEPVEVGRG